MTKPRITPTRRPCNINVYVLNPGQDDKFPWSWWCSAHQDGGGGFSTKEEAESDSANCSD